MMTYFATDGSYGDPNGLVILDTTDWTPEDWDNIDAESDWLRIDRALQIVKDKYHEA